MLLRAYGHADDGTGWVFRMKWSRSPPEKQKSVFWLFPLDFRAPFPPLLLPKTKIIASLCYSVSTLPGAGCSYHSALPLSPPSKCFSGDAACRHLALFAFPSLVPLSVPLEERHLLHYFFSSDDTCGRIREEDRGVGGPRWIQRLISHMAAELYKYICWGEREREKKNTRWAIKIINALIYFHLFNCLFFLSPRFSPFTSPL